LLAFDLSLVMGNPYGAGTPRHLEALVQIPLCHLVALLRPFSPQRAI
jgi:hypothetical protein